MSVSPTYCLLYFLHSIKYTRFLVLQVAAVRTLYAWLVTVLWNVSVALMCWHVLQCLMLHGLFPFCLVSSGMGFSCALTNSCCMFFLVLPGGPAVLPHSNLARSCNPLHVCEHLPLRVCLECLLHHVWGTFLWLPQSSRRGWWATRSLSRTPRTSLRSSS